MLIIKFKFPQTPLHGPLVPSPLLTSWGVHWVSCCSFPLLLRPQSGTLAPLILRGSVQGWPVPEAMPVSGQRERLAVPGRWLGPWGSVLNSCAVSSLTLSGRILLLFEPPGPRSCWEQSPACRHDRTDWCPCTGPVAGCSTGLACDWKGLHISPRAWGWALTQGNNHNHHNHHGDNGHDAMALVISRTSISSEHVPSHQAASHGQVHSALSSSVLSCPMARKLLAVLVLVIGQGAAAWGV